MSGGTQVVLVVADRQHDDLDRRQRLERTQEIENVRGVEEGNGFGNEVRWFILLAVFDVIFLTLGAVTFEFVIEE